MHQEMKDYSKGFNYKDLNLSEIAEETFKSCGKNLVFSKFGQFYDRTSCKGKDNLIVFKIQDTLNPVFHPNRPYYVKLSLIS